MMMARQKVSGGAFVPTDIADCSLWLDASNAGSITEAGGVVSAWADLSPSGYSLASDQGDILTGSRTVNGHNALDFQANGRLRASPAPVNAPADGTWTVIAVAVSDALSQTRQIVCGDAVQEGVRVGQYLRTALATPQSIAWPDIATATGPALSTSTTHVIRSDNDASSLTVSVDGVAGTPVGLGSSYYSASAVLAIGSYAALTNPAEFWDGAVCEVITYARALTPEEITTVEDYLSGKWQA